MGDCWLACSRAEPGWRPRAPGTIRVTAPSLCGCADAATCCVPDPRPSPIPTCWPSGEGPAGRDFSLVHQVLDLPELIRPFLSASDRLSVGLAASWLLAFRDRASTLHLRVKDTRAAEVGARLVSCSFTALKALHVRVTRPPTSLSLLGRVGPPDDPEPSTTDPRLQRLLDALSASGRGLPSTLTSLHLGGSRLQETGAAQLADLLSSSYSSGEPGVFSSPRLSPSSTLSFSQPGTAGLQVLDLSGAGIGGVGASTLAAALCSPAQSSGRCLRELHLSHNRLGDPGVAQLCDGLLPVLPRLHVLDLAHNGLGPDGLRSLCQSLQACGGSLGLRSLSLGYNAMGDACFQLLVHTLAQSAPQLRRLACPAAAVAPEAAAVLAEMLGQGVACWQGLQALDLRQNEVGAFLGRLLRSRTAEPPPLQLQELSLSRAECVADVMPLLPSLTSLHLSLLDHHEAIRLLEDGLGGSRRPTPPPPMAGVAEARTSALTLLQLEVSYLHDSGAALLASCMAMGHLPALEELRLLDCRIKQTGGHALTVGLGSGRCRRLRVLNLTGNKLGDALGEGLRNAWRKGGCPALEAIWLPRCGLTERDISAMVSSLRAGDCPRLHTLVLSCNPQLGDASAAHLASLLHGSAAGRALRTLHLRQAGLHMAGLRALILGPDDATRGGGANAFQLRSLNLAQNEQLGPECAKLLSSLPATSSLLRGLTELDLSSCGLGPHGVQLLLESPEAKALAWELRLHNNGFSPRDQAGMTLVDV